MYATDHRRTPAARPPSAFPTSVLRANAARRASRRIATARRGAELVELMRWRRGAEHVELMSGRLGSSPPRQGWTHVARPASHRYRGGARSNRRPRLHVCGVVAGELGDLVAILRLRICTFDPLLVRAHVTAWSRPLGCTPPASCSAGRCARGTERHAVLLSGLIGFEVAVLG